MPLLAPIIKWLGEKWIHVLAIGFVAILTVGISAGVPYKLFVKDTNKTSYLSPVTQHTQDIKVYPLGCARFDTDHKPK